MANERGTSDFGTVEIASRTSADGGRTWGDEWILVRPDLAEDLSVQAPALRRLESGDLLHMCLHSHRADGEGELGGGSSMELFRSCDEGDTWRKAEGDIDLPMRGAMEASVAELLDGELVLSLRTQLGAVFLSRSYDGGQHWSLPADDGPALA